MKMKGILEFEYELDDEDLKLIREGFLEPARRVDPSADDYEEAESEFFENDPEEYLQQRLHDNPIIPLDNATLKLKITSWR